MNLPNKLTIGRIGLTFLMAFFLTMPGMPFGKTLALLIFAIAGFSDIWDGYLARSRNMITAFGQLMDPLADKILVCAAFVSFVAIGHIIHAWIVIIIISREFVVTGLRLLAAMSGKVLPAGFWGKHKMIWQMVLIVTILVGLSARDELLPLVIHGETLTMALDLMSRYFFPWLVGALSLLVAALTLVSGLVYLWEGRDLYRQDL